MNLRKKCTNNKFNRKTRAFEELLDDEKFVKEFTNATVKNWKGLKMQYLEDLLLVDIANQNPDDMLEYSEENAQTLVDNSLENFRSEKPKKVVKAPNPVSGQ